MEQSSTSCSRWLSLYWWILFPVCIIGYASFIAIGCFFNEFVWPRFDYDTRCDSTQPQFYITAFFSGIGDIFILFVAMIPISLLLAIIVFPFALLIRWRCGYYSSASITEYGEDERTILLVSQ